MSTLTITAEMIYAICPDGRSIKAARDLTPAQFRELAANTDGTWLQATCRGSDPTPYRVKADLRDGEASFDCTCVSPKYPCKHAIGLLFQRMNRPGDFKGIPTPGSSRARVGQHFKVPLAAPAPAEAPPAKDEGEALLRAIYEEPEEVAHRLVYADWLEERGGADAAARAQFIRLQCQAERLLVVSRERETMEKQAERLLNKHRAKWLADVPAYVRKERLEMVGGFPGRLRMTPAHVERYGPTLVEKHPITAVRLTGAVGADEGGDLALLPMWGRIRELDLSGQLQQRQRALALLASPYLSALHTLRLAANDLGLPEVHVLVGFPGPGRLAELDLRNNSINARSLAVLLGADLSRLRRLLLGSNPLGAAGVDALAAWRPAVSLERLDLGECGLSARSIKALLAAPAIAGLRRLELWGNTLDAATARALVESPVLEQIEHLGVKGTGLDAASKELLRARFGDRVSLV